MENNQQEFPFSLGTNPVMPVLIKLVQDGVDVVAINAGTILRNCLSNQDVQDAAKADIARKAKTDRPAKLAVQACDKEIFTMVSTLDNVFRQAGTTNPAVIVYHGEYQRLIPKELYKEPTESKYNQLLAENMLSKNVIGDSLKTRKLSTVQLFNLPVCKSKFPYMYLDDTIRRLRNMHSVAIVTHHYIDCHVGKFCKSLTLVRSFTGETVDYKNLHNVVFGNNIIPFNVYTHAILGDKSDFKSSLNKQETQKLLEIAERESWILKTSEYSKEALSRLGVSIPFKI